MKFQCFKIIAGMGLCLAFSQGEAFIAGAKASGMGQTGIAYAQDAYGAVYNPAGAVDVGDRADITYEWMHNSKYATQTSADTLTTIKYNALTSRDFNNGDFAINKMMCTEMWGGSLNWALGIAGYNSEFIRTNYKEPFPLLGTSNAGMEYRRYTLSPFAAIEINCSHSIGLSVDAHAQCFKADGLEKIAVQAALPTTPPAFGSQYPKHVTNHGYSHSGGVSATLGWRWKIYDCLAFGLTYRTDAKMSRFKKYKGLLSKWGLLNVPEKWAMGLAYRFHPRALVTADVEWIDWASLVSWNKHLINGDGTATPTVNPFGGKATHNGSNGPGFGWRDQTIYRLGLEYTLTQSLTVRGGYIYARSLANGEQNLLNSMLINVVRSYLTVGASWLVNPCNEISFFYAHGFVHKIKGHDSVTGKSGGPEVGIKESKDLAGISWGYMY